MAMIISNLPKTRPNNLIGSQQFLLCSAPLCHKSFHLSEYMFIIRRLYRQDQ